MSDAGNSETMVQPVAAVEGEGTDEPVLSGDNILALFQEATGLADGNSRYAVEIARNLSRQLVVVKDRCTELERRVAELEDEVQFHRDRSERAEQWLNKISSEIQERVIGAPH